MKILSSNNLNFKAQVKFDKIYSTDYFFKDIKEQINNSGTNNIYEVKKVQGSSKYHQILLNGEKFKGNLFTKKDGEYSFLKNIYNRILEKEKSILAEMKGSKLNTGLETLRKNARKLGISIEDVKKFL